MSSTSTDAPTGKPTITRLRKTNYHLRKTLKAEFPNGYKTFMGYESLLYRNDAEGNIDEEVTLICQNEFLANLIELKRAPNNYY